MGLIQNGFPNVDRRFQISIAIGAIPEWPILFRLVPSFGCLQEPVQLFTVEIVAYSFFCDSAKEKKGNFKTKPKTFFLIHPILLLPTQRRKGLFDFYSVKTTPPTKYGVIMLPPLFSIIFTFFVAFLVVRPYLRVSSFENEPQGWLFLGPAAPTILPVRDV